jgi:hypothetical protein
MWPELCEEAGGSSRWIQRAWLVWALLVLVLFSRFLLAPHKHTTFHYYRDAGWNWWSSQELYQETGETCRYSPVVHAFLMPTALLPHPFGEGLWRLINTAAFLGGLWWWTRTALPGSPDGRFRALVLLGTIPFALGSLDNAQSNPLLTGALLAGIAAALTDRWNLTAAALAVACLLKIYPVSLALLLVLVFPGRFTFRFLVAVGIGVLLPFLLQDPNYVARQYANWWSNLRVDQRHEFPLYRAYRDLWLLIQLWNLPVTVDGYRLIQGAGAGLVGVSAWILGRTRLERRLLLQLLLGLASSWMMLLGPATESSTYIVLAPTLSWLTAEAWLRRQDRWLRGLTASAFALAVVARLAGAVRAAAHLHALGPHPLAALLLLGALGRLMLLELARSPTANRRAGVIELVRPAA